MVIRFQDIDFGSTQAEDEAATNAPLLLKGYYDPFDLPQRLAQRRTWLILGAKGSGKSALSEHIRLLAKTNPTQFVSRADLGDFPVPDFTKVQVGSSSRSSAAQGKSSDFRTAWRWLLLLKIYQSLYGDNGLHSSLGEDWRRIILELQRGGFLIDSKLRDQVLSLSRRRVKISLPKIGEYERGREYTQQSLHVGDASAELLAALDSVQSDSSHTLFVDGLDEFFVSGSVEWRILASLVDEAAQLNNRFRQLGGCNLWIVILCRSDLYDRLVFSNANKHRQDGGRDLRWYQDGERTDKMHLFRLALQKARVSDGSIEHLVGEYLPMTATLNKDRTIMSTLDLLLDRTRYSPRDMLTALKYLQAEARDDGKVSNAGLLRGLARYSAQYFRGEVVSCLAGVVKDDDARAAVALLSKVPRPDVSISELESIKAGSERFAEIDLQAILEQLYYSGLIGLTDGRYYNWFYRKEGIAFDVGKKFVLHWALVKALNIPVG